MFKVHITYGTVVIYVEGDDKEWVHEEARTAYTRSENIIQAEMDRLVPMVEEEEPPNE